ncbi:hypothetical protein OPV22_019116 [Ensete ventricosum]|uniref:Uncharacterized protein n=1 Tax=Ensete ventricosum TaxID=4639 RepID=A0AAV8QX51_ENSVE|nr:hypothetical protein OPV22_019116 [Ensete ventricosum]
MIAVVGGFCGPQNHRPPAFSPLFLSRWPLSPARSVLRSPSLRGGAARIAAQAMASSRPPLRCLPKPRPAVATRFLRSPVEASFCMEGYGCLSEGRDETR